MKTARRDAMRTKVVLGAVIGLALLGFAGGGTASCPENLVGFMETTPDEMPPTYEAFEWYSYFGSRPLTDQVLTVELAIIPMMGVWTAAGLDAFDGPTFFALNFDGRGNVQSVVPGPVIATYTTGGWNDVSAMLRFATQDFLLKLNGESFGPIPFGLPALSVQAFRVNGGNTVNPAWGWIDQIRIGLAGVGILFEEDFDHGRDFSMFHGRLTPVPPPPGFRVPPSCLADVEASAADPPEIGPVVIVLSGLGVIPPAFLLGRRGSRGN